MSSLTKPNQFLFPNTSLAGRHWSNRHSGAAYSAQLSVPAAGTYYTDLAGILKPGLINMGIHFQPDGFDVTPSLTLAYFADVEDDPANVPWFALSEVTNGNIGATTLAGNALKLVCSGKGILYIACL